MPSLDSRVTCNLFYYQELAYQPEKAYLGYLKASVVSFIGSGGKPRSHAYFPLFFVPFMFKKKEYVFADHFAFEAKDVSLEDHDILSKEWEFSYLNPPQKEQERLGIILRKVSENLQSYVQAARPLTRQKSARRTRFLGQFPRQLREGIGVKLMCGTLDKVERVISIYASDFQGHQSRSYIPRGNLSPGRMSYSLGKTTF